MLWYRKWRERFRSHFVRGPFHSLCVPPSHGRSRSASLSLSELGVRSLKESFVGRRSLSTHGHTRGRSASSSLSPKKSLPFLSAFAFGLLLPLCLLLSPVCAFHSTRSSAPLPIRSGFGSPSTWRRCLLRHLLTRTSACWHTRPPSSVSSPFITAPCSVPRVVPCRRYARSSRARRSRPWAHFSSLRCRVLPNMGLQTDKSPCLQTGSAVYAGPDLVIV